MDEKNELSQTGRLTVAAVEEILGHEFPVLDHGFVRVVDYMGGDAAIVQAARVSYGKGTKKKGRGNLLSKDEAEDSLLAISKTSAAAYTTYMKLLNEDETGHVMDSDRTGIARELARIVLPTNYYTQWYWKIDLHNLLHFVTLRADAHVQ